MTKIRMLLLSVLVTAAVPLFAECDAVRALVRVAADDDAARIAAAPLPASVESLRALPAPRPLPQQQRVEPTETTIYTVTATLVEYTGGGDDDQHLVLSDEAGRTIVATIPAARCSSGSRFAAAIERVRTELASRFPSTPTYRPAGVPVEISGVGFFGFLQDQRGLAPNGIELRPVTTINLAPDLAPAPPRRRRALGVPVACARPTLLLNLSRSAICSGETSVLSWQASDPKASVTIDQLGANFPASGSATIGATEARVYSGRASNGCGVGSEATAVLSILPSPAATLSTSASSVPQGGSATLTLVTANATSWTLISSIGNPLSVTSGTTNGQRTATYTASRPGVDNVALSVTGACGTADRAVVITVTTTPTPTPQPPGGGLLCCDGTRSASCFSCSSKQGCCSNHNGVCGCP
ncbi:MAG TPA: hypothetical protein VJ276_16515 [Thermoanaerobaculia bacterium]|nr:hypothetical protein [Thermoanaerobaculia bacterium]